MTKTFSKLVRPENRQSEFTVGATEELITMLFNNRIKGMVFEEELKDHPLMQRLKNNAERSKDCE